MIKAKLKRLLKKKNKIEKIFSVLDGDLEKLANEVFKGAVSICKCDRISEDLLILMVKSADLKKYNLSKCYACNCIEIMNSWASNKSIDESECYNFFDDVIKSNNECNCNVCDLCNIKNLLNKKDNNIN